MNLIKILSAETKKSIMPNTNWIGTKDTVIHAISSFLTKTISHKSEMHSFINKNTFHILLFDLNKISLTITPRYWQSQKRKPNVTDFPDKYVQCKMCFLTTRNTKYTSTRNWFP